MTVTIGTQPVSLEDLEPFPGNARRGNVGLILDSLRANGQYKPLTVRRSGVLLTILAGNHTFLALLRHEEDDRASCTDWELDNDRPCQLCINVDRDDPTALAHIIECDEATAIRINLVDNKAADTGSYDEEALAALLAALEDDLVGSGYALSEVELFASGAVDDLTGDAGPNAEFEDSPGTTRDSAEDDSPPVPEVPAVPVTRPGDVWLLGPHRIMCGDCQDSADVEKLLDGAAVNIAFTSPPYASRRKYDEESGFKPIPPDEYVDWFEDVQASVRAHLADDGSWFVNIKEHCEDGQRHLYVKDLTLAHVRRWGWRFVDELVWHKPDPFPGRYEGRFKNGFEPVFHFAVGRHKHRPDNVMTESVSAIIGTASRKQSPTTFTNEILEAPKGAGRVWPSNVLMIGAGSESDGGTHAAAFPVKLPRWFIKAYTDAGDTVYDPFMGSGSTMLAADREDRVAYGMEISSKYVDVICKRYQEVTGVKPVLERTGKPHDFLEGEVA